MRGELFYYVTSGSNVTRDVHWCVTVDYITIIPWAQVGYEVLLYLLVSTRAVIGQFSGPYSPVRPAKI